MLIIQILKLIGIVLILLIGFVIIISACFLFIPIISNIDADFDNNKLSVKVHDFFNLVSIRYIRENGLNTFSVGFLFNLIKPNLDNTKSDKQRKPKKKRDIKNKENINEKKKENKKKKFKEILTNPSLIDAFKALVKEGVCILKKLVPKVVEADIDFAAGYPDYTGLITGAISLIPYSYGKKVSISPDFLSEKAYINGKLRLGGRLFMVSLVGSFIRLLNNKDIRNIVFPRKRKMHNL